MRSAFVALTLSFGLALTACGENVPQVAADVGGARIIAADPGEWMSHGRTYDEQRFSPLTQINDQNVDALGLAWFADLPTRRGMEATPLVVDGIMAPDQQT